MSTREKKQINETRAASNLLHSASVSGQCHPQLEETWAFKFFKEFGRVGGVGVAVPLDPGLGSSSLLLAQQHGEVEAGSVVQLVVHLQAGAVNFNEGGVGCRGEFGCHTRSRVDGHLRGRVRGRWSQAEQQFGQRESQQLHWTGRAGDVIAQHYAGLAQEDPEGELSRPEHKT